MPLESEYTQILNAMEQKMENGFMDKRIRTDSFTQTMRIAGSKHWNEWGLADFFYLFRSKTANG